MTQTASQTIDRYTMTTYARQPVTFVRGEGVLLFDDRGKSYRDFLAGIAVCNLGHTHPAVTKAICDQALKLTHVSNLFYTEPQAETARLLVKSCFADRVFFCNSGAEANEGALKLSRLWGKKYLGGAYGVITMKGSFHGRTMKTLTATGQKKIQEGFEPLAPGFKYAEYGNLDSLTESWDDNTCAVMLEPILGEGGVVMPPEGYLEGVRKLCDERGAMLIYDEIQTGLGRTGAFFAHQHSGVAPDVMTLAKGLANGLPVGAVLATEKAAELFTPGKHGTTFGAGPVVMAAAAAVMNQMLAQGFMDRVRETGEYFKAGLVALASKHEAKITGVRGMGLILGLVLAASCGEMVGAMLEKGFVVNCTQGNVLRFLPPLVVGKEDIDALLAALDEAIEAWEPK